MIKNLESNSKEFAEGATQYDSTFNQPCLKATPPNQQAATVYATDNVISRYLHSVAQPELANANARQADVEVHCLSMSPNIFSDEAELDGSSRVPTISSQVTFPPFRPQSLTPGLSTGTTNTPAQSLLTPLGGTLPLPVAYRNPTDGVLDGLNPLKRLEKRKLVDSGVDEFRVPSIVSFEESNNYRLERSGMGLAASRNNSHNPFPPPLRLSYQPPAFHPRPSSSSYTAHHQDGAGVASTSLQSLPSPMSLYPAQTKPVATHPNQWDGSHTLPLYLTPSQSSTSSTPLPASNSYVMTLIPFFNH